MQTEGLFMPEVVREYLTAHAEEILADVGRYDGVHHELNPRYYVWFTHIVDEEGKLREGYEPKNAEAWRADTQVYEEYIRTIRPHFIQDFRAYIASPSTVFMAVGDRVEQTAEELAQLYLDSGQRVQFRRGKLPVYPGYVFRLPELGVRVATIEKSLIQRPFKESLQQVTSLLSGEGYVPVDRRLWER